MSDMRKDNCDRCGFNEVIFHRGEVPRKLPYKGMKEVKFCKPCYDMITSGRDMLNALMPDAKGAAVTNFDRHSRPKPAVPDPSQEIRRIYFSTKVIIFVTGFTAGMLFGGMAVALFFLQGGAP